MMSTNRQGDIPTISVLMPVFGQENPCYLTDSLQSLVEQTLPPVQVVIVENSGRSEEVEAVFEKYQSELPLDFLMLEPGLTLGALLNKGLDRCRGDFIARMDSDDISLPQRFERQVVFLERNPDIDVLGSCAIEIDAEGKRGALRKRPLSHLAIIKTLWANPFVHPTIMCRKGLLQSVGGYSETLTGEDYELWFRGAKAGWRFANLEEPLILYRFDAKALRKPWRSMKFALQQGMVGFKMGGELKMPLWSRLACFAPFFRALLPDCVKYPLYKIQKKLDPRYRL